MNQMATWPTSDERAGNQAKGQGATQRARACCCWIGCEFMGTLYNWPLGWPKTLRVVDGKYIGEHCASPYAAPNQSSA